MDHLSAHSHANELMEPNNLPTDKSYHRDSTPQGEV